jgi:hypothetical protein
MTNDTPHVELTVYQIKFNQLNHSSRYPFGEDLTRVHFLGSLKDFVPNKIIKNMELVVTLVTEESLYVDGSRTSDLREFSKFRDLSENHSSVFPSTLDGSRTRFLTKVFVNFSFRQRIAQRQQN